MKRMIENADTIRAQEVGAALPRDVTDGMVEIEIVGIGIQELVVISSEANFGGHQRWLTCPSCGRRVGKLYLPPNEIAFLCRRCHHLAYRNQIVRDGRRRRKDRRTRQQHERLALMEMVRKAMRENLANSLQEKLFERNKNSHEVHSCY